MKKVLMKICEELGSVKYFLIEYYISIAAILFMLFTARSGQRHIAMTY